MPNIDAAYHVILHSRHIKKENPFALGLLRMLRTFSGNALTAHDKAMKWAAEFYKESVEEKRRRLFPVSEDEFERKYTFEDSGGDKYVYLIEVVRGPVPEQV